MKEEEEGKKEEDIFLVFPTVVNKERIAVAFLSKSILFFCRARSLSLSLFRAIRKTR
jgi:hypothetical protein